MSKRVDTAARIIAEEAFPGEPIGEMSDEKRLWCRRVGVRVALAQPLFFTEEQALLMEFSKWLRENLERNTETSEGLVNEFLRLQGKKFEA
jgi:hypothetical protein